MSHAATKWAFDQPELHRDMKPSEWAVLMVLADCHNPVNGCFPSQDYICCKTNLAERAVRDQLARLRERGLVDWDMARENGRRGSNRYRLGFEPGFLPAKSAGRSTGENEQSLPAESDSSNRQNLPPNLVKEPVKEPEREAHASDGQETEPAEAGTVVEDPKAIERTFWALVKDWPGFSGMPKEPAKRAWLQLGADDRAEAVRKFPHWLALLKAQRKSHVPAPSTYFGERLWLDVPEPDEAEAPTAELAQPFGQLWGAARLKVLLAGPNGPTSQLTIVERTMVEQGRYTAEQLLADKRAKQGFPTINAMHDRAAHRQGVTVATKLKPLAALMEAVPVGCETYQAWADEHARRGWPWIPDPGAMRVVWFPRGGPGGLEAFEQAVADLNEGNGNDGDRREAAE